MSIRKRLLQIAILAVVVIAAIYAYRGFFETANAEHMQGAVSNDLRNIYQDLCAYRKANGRWPECLEAAGKRPGSLLEGGAYATDPIYHQPFLYFPNAKPESKEILLAQPVPIVVSIWPFKFRWERAICSDGSAVDPHSEK